MALDLAFSVRQRQGSWVAQPTASDARAAYHVHSNSVRVQVCICEQPRHLMNASPVHMPDLAGCSASW